MAFTANHYKEVARIIHDRAIGGLANLDACESEGYRTALRHVAEDLRRMFSRQNPGFDAARFDRDCTPTPKQERT